MGHTASLIHSFFCASRCVIRFVPYIPHVLSCVVSSESFLTFLTLCHVVLCHQTRPLHSSCCVMSHASTSCCVMRSAPYNPYVVSCHVSCHVVSARNAVTAEPSLGFELLGR